MLLAATLLAAGCAAHQPPPPPGQDLPGFLHGLWHGFIVMFSLVGSIIWDVRVYAYPNDGFWYDLGFVLGVTLTFRGFDTAVKQTRKRRREEEPD
jgi:hypothetical protein